MCVYCGKGGERPVVVSDCCDFSVVDMTGCVCVCVCVCVCAYQRYIVACNVNHVYIMG